MMIDRIIRAALPSAAGRRVQDVRLGLGLCGVMLDDGSCGVSFVFRSEITTPHCAVVDDQGALAGREVTEVIPWAADYRNLARASIGVAVLNALSQKSLPSGAAEGDALDWLEISPDDVVGMIGYFKPLVEPVRQKAKALMIFERRPSDDDPDIYPDWAERALLPQCSVVIISGTTIINKTVDQILEWSTGAREIALVGPSVPFYPEAYRDSGITLLGASQVGPGSERVILDLIGQGGGGLSLFGHLRKVTVRLPRCFQGTQGR
ncbi:MAG: DUF364 domain-containing protein [Clostridia bacterium]|jgi:uncharacterized protein (DUF4213/DUF364 family)|nr:DUF364 domain-containing protein [Clostridia bacterium]MDH7572832.1 DUF364 domain-containing protein [Clostridia bacterium]